MRLITIALAVLLVLIQYPLWMGKGGWLRVWDLHRQLQAVQEKNEAQKLKNARLASEVRSLSEGTEAIEERARSELSMIRKGEIFIQLLEETDDAKEATTDDVKKATPPPETPSEKQ